MVKLLIKMGARTDVVNDIGYTPLDYSKSEGMTGILRR